MNQDGTRDATPARDGPALQRAGIGDLPDGTSRRKVLLLDLDGVRWDKLQEAATPTLDGLAAVGPGASGRDVDAASRVAIEEAGLGALYGHGLGHGVGLEIHEGPSLRADGEDVLPTGAVVTVEPGVYLPGLGGVRIEDMIVVGDGPGLRLAGAPRELLVL